MKTGTRRRLNDLVETYARTTSVMEHGAAKAIKEEGRAYGGVIRAAKGQLQEFITDELVQIAWNIELKKDPKRLTINSEKIPIPIKLEYVEKISDTSIKDYILSNMKRYYYGLSVDKHIFIDKNFVIGIECKAYAELAMFKRILVDFRLLKTVYPNLFCYLFQLENMLGGDYSTEIQLPKGSCSAHTVMSYFSDVDLKIITLLSGERKVKQPIHKPEFFKALTIDRLEVAIEAILDGFGKCKVI
jgi:hypothetical protein